MSESLAIAPDVCRKMKILLEDKAAGLYFVAPGKWTKKPDEAQCFENEKQALDAALQLNLSKGAIAYHFPNPVSNFSVALEHAANKSAR